MNTNGNARNRGGSILYFYHPSSSPPFQIQNYSPLKVGDIDQYSAKLFFPRLKVLPVLPLSELKALKVSMAKVLCASLISTVIVRVHKYIMYESAAF